MEVAETTIIICSIIAFAGVAYLIVQGAPTIREFLDVMMSSMKLAFPHRGNFGLRLRVSPMQC